MEDLKAKTAYHISDNHISFSVWIFQIFLQLTFYKELVAEQHCFVYVMLNLLQTWFKKFFFCFEEILQKFFRLNRLGIHN